MARLCPGPCPLPTRSPGRLPPPLRDSLHPGLLGWAALMG